MMHKPHDTVQNLSRTLNITLFIILKNFKQLSHDHDQVRTEDICVLGCGFVTCEVRRGLQTNEERYKQPPLLNRKEMEVHLIARSY